VLEISNKKELVKIPLLTLNHPVELYTFSASEFLTHLSVQRQLFKATMFISWSSLRIKHRFLTHVLELPSTVSVDILTACRAQRILANCYEALIFTRAKVSDQYQLLPRRVHMAGAAESDTEFQSPTSANYAGTRSYTRLRSAPIPCLCNEAD
jgi:hypothetical protein